jgi:hypothetical protein
MIIIGHHHTRNINKSRLSGRLPTHLSKGNFLQSLFQSQFTEKVDTIWRRESSTRFVEHFETIELNDYQIDSMLISSTLIQGGPPCCQVRFKAVLILQVLAYTSMPYYPVGIVLFFCPCSLTHLCSHTVTNCSLPHSLPHNVTSLLTNSQGPSDKVV